MKILMLSKICEVIGAVTCYSDAIIKRVENETKRLKNNTLIFHIHKTEEIDFDKLNQLETCYIVTDQPLLKDSNLNKDHFIYVLDIKEAYSKFIKYYRSLFNIPVVAITGTCGKTTTKEIIKQVLEKRYKIASTISNKNNLGYNHDYLMSIDANTKFGVFETAISKPGDLIIGCNYFKPTIGVITNIGIDHLQGCKTLDNYIQTKGEMLIGLENKNTLIINNDDDNIKKINMDNYKGKIITFGIDNKSDYTAININYNQNNMEFTLLYSDNEYHVSIPGLGKHNVYNCLAALAVLNNLGLNLNQCIEDVKSIKYIRSHLEFHNGYNSSVIIDDTWSSNPTSLKAALEVLKDIGKDKIKIAVLGKISYLGDYAKDQYISIGKMIGNYVDILVTTDSFSKQIGLSAIESGLKKEYYFHIPDNDELLNNLKLLVDKNTIVLFKISMLSQSITSVMKQLITEEK